MARRRVSEVLDQQKVLREIGRIRFGERKRPSAPGRPIPYPRVTSQNEGVIREVADVFGGEVKQWPRDENSPPEWEVTIDGPLAIACPPFVIPYSTAYEQWAGSINTVRCDGITCDVHRGKGKYKVEPCICAARGIEPEDRPCKKTTRINVLIVGIKTLGTFRCETKSHYASEQVPAMLELLQMSGRAGWLLMRSQKRTVYGEVQKGPKKGQEEVQTKKFPVIVVEADFHAEEVMQLDRPASMAALPAPVTRALPRGERPALGPGADVPVLGPQPEDSTAPPADDAEPIDMDAPLEGQVMSEHDAKVVDEAWPSDDDGQGALPGIEGGRTPTPGDT